MLLKLLFVAKLLVVEDDLDVSAMLEQVLLMDGHEVCVAHNGEEGMLLVESDKPDIAILDIEMPILSGPGMVLRMFAHNCGLEKIPIILMSGHVEMKAIAEEIGTPYTLAKPFQIDDLFSLVRLVSRERVSPQPRLNKSTAA